jgi:tetratricopeptide (TPR) repeat protein
MPHSHGTDGTRALDVVTDRNAKIEQLLLAGLDHYFAAQYEQAINIWTRALFLDRNHARARAYIDRARSALAERQRQSEELLHDGVAAFNRGDSGEARRLLEAAIAGGAPSDEAHVVLDRLDRLEVVQPPSPDRPGRAETNLVAPVATPAPRHPRRSVWVGIGVFSFGVAALLFGAARWNFGPWGSLGAEPAAPGISIAPSRDAALPLPRRAEMALARARALAAGGHLRDALSKLEAISLTDPEKGDADRLRADIQRQLLALDAPKQP